MSRGFLAVSSGSDTGGGLRGLDEQLVSFLRRYNLEQFAPNFRRELVVYEDLPELDDEALARLVPPDIPRRRLKRNIDKAFCAMLLDTPPIQPDALDSFSGLQRRFSDNPVVLNPSSVKVGSETIAAGSFGSVKLGALNAGITTLDVVVKVLPLAQDQTPEDVIRETALMHALNHRHVVKTFGMWFPDNFTANIVLEYCSLGDLQKYIDRNPAVPPRLKMSFLKQIASGMQYIHSQKIIHRDLKLENVLVGDNMIMKLCDFGSSKTASSVTGTIVGTGQYIAPEVGEGGDSDPKLCDIYSFGILIWHLWTGTVPYSDTPRCEGKLGVPLMMEIRQGDCRPNLSNPKLSDCPQELIDLATDCWDVDPSMRPSDFGIVLDTLKGIRV